MAPTVIHVQENYAVVVQFPKSLRTRCGEFWMLCNQLLWTGCGAFWLMVAAAIGAACFVVIVTFASLWIPIVISHCHKPPGIVMENFSIRNMAVIYNTTSTPDSPWLVNSGFNATFSTWNKNTVAKCFTTYRHMDVRVEYKGQVILQQQIPLGFSLKPRRSRPVWVEMKGDHVQLKRSDLGPLMEAELRSGNISLDFYFDFRYLIADRRSYWEHHGCTVVAKTPLESSRLGTMLKQECYSL